MPSGKTRFNASWLHKIDNNGHHLGQWCKADTVSIFNGFCYVCIKSISCSNNGVKQLISHADGISHKELMKVKLSDSQNISLSVEEIRRPVYPVPHKQEVMLRRQGQLCTFSLLLSKRKYARQRHVGLLKWHLVDINIILVKESLNCFKTCLKATQSPETSQ